MNLVVSHFVDWTSPESEILPGFWKFHEPGRSDKWTNRWLSPPNIIPHALPRKERGQRAIFRHEERVSEISSSGLKKIKTLTSEWTTPGGLPQFRPALLSQRGWPLWRSAASKIGIQRRSTTDVKRPKSGGGGGGGLMRIRWLLMPHNVVTAFDTSRVCPRTCCLLRLRARREESYTISQVLRSVWFDGKRRRKRNPIGLLSPSQVSSLVRRASKICHASNLTYRRRATQNVRGWD